MCYTIGNTMSRIKSKRNQEIIKLRKVNKLSYREIAELKHLSHVAVIHIIKRGY